MMKLVHEENLGRTVLCDLCNMDYTDMPTTGGFIYGSKAVCPTCAPKMMYDIRRYGEQAYIRAINKASNKSFADFVRDYRGEDASIRIYTA